MQAYREGKARGRDVASVFPSSKLHSHMAFLHGVTEAYSLHIRYECKHYTTISIHMHIQPPSHSYTGCPGKLGTGAYAGRFSRFSSTQSRARLFRQTGGDYTYIHLHLGRTIWLEARLNSCGQWMHWSFHKQCYIFLPLAHIQQHFM